MNDDKDFEVLDFNEGTPEDAANIQNAANKRANFNKHNNHSNNNHNGFRKPFKPLTNNKKNVNDANNPLNKQNGLRKNRLNKKNKSLDEDNSLNKKNDNLDEKERLNKNSSMEKEGLEEKNKLSKKEGLNKGRGLNKGKSKEKKKSLKDKASPKGIAKKGVKEVKNVASEKVKSTLKKVFIMYVLPVLLFLLLIITIVASILSIIETAMAYLDGAATYLANTHEKLDNFMNGLGFQNSEDAFYDELNYLNKKYGYELNVPILMSALFYDDINSNGSFEKGEISVSEDGDTDAFAYGMARSWIKSKIKESNVTVGKDGLEYSSNKIYRLRKLAKHQLDDSEFGSGKNKIEKTVSLGSYIELVKEQLGGELVAILKNIPADILTWNPGNVMESLAQVFSGDEVFTTTDLGAHFEENTFTHLYDLLKIMFNAIEDIDSVGLCGSGICVTYSTYAYSEEAFTNYLKSYYIPNMPEFKKYISAESEEIRNREIDKIIEDIKNLSKSYEEIFGVQKVTTENYNSTCVGNIKQSLLGELRSPVEYSINPSFVDKYSFGIHEGISHKGLDLNQTTIGVNEGDLVYSGGEKGKVLESTLDGTYKGSENGGWLKIRYKSASGEELYTYTVIYGGLKKDSITLKKGDEVEKDAIIGSIGSIEESEDGELASLHFGFYDDTAKAFLDPTNLFIPCTGNGSGFDMGLHDIYSISESNFIAALKSYCSDGSCNSMLNSINLNTIYRSSVENNLNPRFTVVRAIREGFEPHDRCGNYNYWGIGVYNESGGCGISYSSLSDGVKGLATLDIVKDNNTLLDLMKEYAYIGDYWYPITYESNGGTNWGIGGCAYLTYMEEYYTNKARYAEVKTWCDNGTGGSHRTNDEDQEAYAKFNSREMNKLDNEIFGPYLSTAQSSSNGSSLITTNGVLYWPAPTCTVITSTYGNRESPTAGASTDHRAIDIGCEQGSNIVAAADGEVTISDSSDIRGYYIVIKHTINGQRVDTLYQHLSARNVSVGQPVYKGQVIGKSGGDPGTEGAGTSSGAHLHFEVHNGEFAYHQNEVNPCTYLGLSVCEGDISSALNR